MTDFYNIAPARLKLPAGFAVDEKIDKHQGSSLQ